MSAFVIYDDSRDIYFIQLGLGIFWECGERSRAKKFANRAAAVKVMQSAGKHKQGWRVVKVSL
jgi:hypothetical protein